MANLHEYLVSGAYVIGVIFISFVICMMFVAPERIHSEQLVALNEANRNLKAATEILESRGPKLVGRVPGVYMGSSSVLEVPPEYDVAIPNGFFVLFLVAVRNTGEPSVAHGWQCSAQWADGTAADGLVLALPLVTLNAPTSGGGEFKVPVSIDKLMVKAGATPLEYGDIRRGFVLAVFKDFGHDKNKSQMDLKVRFRDVNNSPHECVFLPNRRLIDLKNLPKNMGPMLEGSF